MISDYCHTMSIFTLLHMGMTQSLWDTFKQHKQQFDSPVCRLKSPAPSSQLCSREFFFLFLRSGVFLLSRQSDSVPTAALTSLNTTMTSSHKRLPTVPRLLTDLETGSAPWGWKQIMLLSRHSAESSGRWQHVYLQKSRWGLCTLSRLPHSLWFR